MSLLCKNVSTAAYNILHNSIDVYTYAGYFLRIDCNKAEEGLKKEDKSKEEQRKHNYRRNNHRR
jgi:hypothetical protein